MIAQWGPGPFPSASVADVRKNLQCGSALVPNKSGQKAEAGLDQANRGPWAKSGPPSCESPRAVLTKYTKQGAYNIRNVLSLSCDPRTEVQD